MKSVKRRKNVWTGKDDVEILRRVDEGRSDCKVNVGVVNLRSRCRWERCSKK